MNETDKLNLAAISAHQNQDLPALARIYETYGRSKIKENDIDCGCFYLSTAYAFALECGLQTAPEIHKLLIHYKREE
tara:strand:+ start:986 stop:1216 length:231 start_codon:yes stop_codon:yes gene_type:complete